jgi:hypothetical protein
LKFSKFSNRVSLYIRKLVKLDNEHWYQHVPKSVETSQEGKLTILWNQQAPTNRTIPNNKRTSKSRIMKKEHVCMLIDVAIPGDRNVIEKLRRF